MIVKERSTAVHLAYLLFSVAQSTVNINRAGRTTFQPLEFAKSSRYSNRAVITLYSNRTVIVIIEHSVYNINTLITLVQSG